MSDTIQTGGPAFPHLGTYLGADGDLHPTPTQYCGLTLRDYLAAKALQGFLANPVLAEGFSVGCNQDAEKTPLAMAKRAYDYADAVLAVREQK